MPQLLTFIALLGGVEVLGVTGLLLGPVIVTVCVAILRTYEDEIRDAQRPSLNPELRSSPDIEGPPISPRLQSR